MIYDCFQFFNELDILEIRLEELYPIVDKFILCESTITHSGKPKEQIFQNTIERYNKYLDKIEYVLFDKFPEETNRSYWTLENDQRRHIINGIDLNTLQDDDVIIISDIDEIPNRKFLDSFIKKYINNSLPNYPIVICSQLYYGKITNKVIEPSYFMNWNGSVVINGKILKSNPDIQYYRKNIDFFPRIQNNGSWHFSYMGTIDDIIKKLESTVHTEWDIQEAKDKLKERIDKCEEPLGRQAKLIKVPIDDSYPEAIKNNPERYAHII
jgi:beta-1,4-mannosyl-glycoprotein beta-1,4-N-acetylglucosaminyltransferase